jgi:hypothetical protein
MNDVARSIPRDHRCELRALASLWSPALPGTRLVSTLDETLFIEQSNKAQHSIALFERASQSCLSVMPVRRASFSSCPTCWRQMSSRVKIGLRRHRGEMHERRRIITVSDRATQTSQRDHRKRSQYARAARYEWSSPPRSVAVRECHLQPRAAQDYTSECQPAHHCWLALRQFSEAFPWETAPHYLLRDSDSSYGGCFRYRAQAMGIMEVGHRAPFAVAKCIRRAGHWLDSPRVFGSCDYV